MKKTIALFSALAILSSAAVLAAPPVKPAKGKSGVKVAKVVDVWTCPMTGEAIKDHKGTGTPVVVGNMRAHFCCGSCPDAFAKLSAKDKQTKLAEAAKKDKASATKKS